MSAMYLYAPPLQCRSSLNFRVAPGHTTSALAPTLKGRRIDLEGARRHRRDVPAIFEVNFDEGSFQSGSLQVLPIECSDFQLSPYDAAAAAAAAATLITHTSKV